MSLLIPDGRIDRRSLLKSAGIFLGASALSTESSFAGPPEAKSQNSNTTPAILEPMVGFMLAHEQFRVPELVELGAEAEQAGFQLLANSDHLQPWQSNEGHSGQAWVTMSALGQRTRHAWIGPTVTCPSFRYNPAVAAEAFASLSLLYPGRIFLGIGSGEALNEEAAVGSWPKWQERSDRLIEATGIIRRLWSGETVKHSGAYYSLNTKLYDPPTSTIPLLMAGNGPKAMKRAGQYADGLITDPKTWKEHHSEFEAAAKTAGKNPREMPVLVEAFVVVGSNADAKAPAELWRFLPKAFKTYYNVASPEKIQQMAETELPLEDIYKDWIVSPDPEAHIRGIMDLFHQGATIVNVHSGQADQKQVIRFYGQHVIPHLKKQMSRT